MKYVLYNPLANNKNGEQGARTLEERMPQEELTFVDVTTLKSVREFVSGLEEADEVILAGGDGTINQFANELNNIEAKCGIKFFPCGSGNDFVRDIRDNSITEIVDIKNYIQNLPVANINDVEYHFLNNVAFGLDGYCCEKADEHKMKSDKKVNYTMIALKGVAYDYKPKKGRVIVDGVVKEYDKIWMAPTMKGRYMGGGMKIAPMQDRQNPDKSITLCVLHDCSRVQILAVFLNVFKGTHTKFTKMIDFITVHNEVTVEYDEMDSAQIDGETIKGVKKYTVKVQ